MNFRLVLQYVGTLLLILSLMMGICLGIGYILPAGAGHSPEKALTGWELSIAITFGSALILRLFGRKEKKAKVKRRDAIGVVGLGWLTCSLFASLPFMLCEPNLSFCAAFFESVSGLTTTGATIFEDLATVPETIHLWRSQCQWLGGLGILAIFVLVLSNVGANGRSLYLGESSAHIQELVDNRLQNTIKLLWVLYISLTVLCALGLWAFEMTLFQAFNHAMTTISTGGFSTEPDSIDGFGIPVKIWLILFMTIGGMSFPLILILVKKTRDLSVLKKHEETWLYLAILSVVSLIIFGIRMAAGGIDISPFAAFVNTAFNTVSLATSTGYGVGDYDTWPPMAKGLLLFLMLIGGCAGSTSGGLKVSRLILWLKMVRAELRRAFRPNQIMSIKLNGWPIPEGTRGQLFLILTMATVSIAISSFILVGMHPSLSVDGCVSAVISCITNVGPAFNEFGPTQNFGVISEPGKILLSILMLVGRLEYIAIFALFSKTFWKHY